jgi:tetratricopeptide (TPR) repeat protein
MKTITTKIMAVMALLILSIAFGCRKEFLDIKSDKKLVVPVTAKDLQALMDNTGAMNTQGDPSLGELGADDFFLTDARWETMSTASQRNGYIWAKDIFETETYSVDWYRPYQMVFYANTVLEGAQKLGDSQAAALLRGQALFARSWAFYGLLQIFAQPYVPGSSNDGPGIPLRLESDINLPSSRATVGEAYRQIVSDLTEALDLLPALPLIKTRASRASASALLARVYLLMGDYDRALDFAERTLALQSSLMDYNTISLTATNPFKSMNDEVIYHSEMAQVAAFGNTRLNVVADLYASYSADDLRKSLFYFNNSGTLAFKGSYTTLPYFFSGLSVDEVMLIRAECLARLNRGPEALDVLNILLVKRWKTGKFVPVSLGTGQTVLQLVLLERRKELIFRALRWPDLRRFNMDPSMKKDLVRVVKGQTYSLPAGDPRYVLPLPVEVLRLTGMPNNPR